jgi:hypothetical protein
VNGTFNGGTGGSSFADGGTITGTFTYDAATNTFSAINLQTQGGNLAPAATFTAQNTTTNQTASLVAFYTQAGLGTYLNTPGLFVTFSPALSETGTSVTINFTQTNCNNANCDTQQSLRAGVGTATVGGGGSNPNSVPTLSEWGMILMTVLLAGAGLLSLRGRGHGAAGI